MYWLFSAHKQEIVRKKIDSLVLSLSTANHKPPHRDQVFPFQGRKAIEHAKIVISELSEEGSTVCDPFVGSGSFAYAGALLKRKVCANEYEPYTHLMASIPFDLPDRRDLQLLFNSLIAAIEPQVSYYYRTLCNCGQELTMDSLFFDRSPLSYTDIDFHERLGEAGENVTFRGQHRCPNCGATEKHFDDFDRSVLEEIEGLEEDFFDFTFIENSRINLSREYLDYRTLFPKRSRIVSFYIWNQIQSVESDESVKKFLESVFLSIVPLMKYKDYRSKSQDLHCPPNKLRETNILNSFVKQFRKRTETLFSYKLSGYKSISFECLDFRRFLSKLDNDSVDIVVTDPPWHDGSAYFERAQLYHPWIEFDLKNDTERLAKEVVVSDSPERPDKNNREQWWGDINDLFEESYRALKDDAFLVLYFRPVPASEWITNFNRLRLIARIHGFEPLLTIDLSNNDPSMRIQQSSHYAFSSDLILTFIKLREDERRTYIDSHDIDEICFRTAVDLQDSLAGPFSLAQWNSAIHENLTQRNLHQLNLPKNKDIRLKSFHRVCEEIAPGAYLPRATTPYSDEIFNVPYIERVSLYIPYVIEELLSKSDIFTFDQFMLKVAEFVENGTRAILKDILEGGENSIHSLLRIYAEPLEEGKYFTKRPTPIIPSSIASLLELDPYEFEGFVAQLLELEGFKNVAISGRAGDRGVDVRCNDQDGNLVIVQCKRYTKSKIGSTPIQRLHSFAQTRGAKRMICITTTDFTPDGYDEARLTNVETIDRVELERLVHRHGMFSKTA